jgi:transposase
LLRGGEVQDIQELKRQGLSICAISSLTGFDRKTVRRYLAGGGQTPLYGPRAPRPSKLDPFKPYVEGRLKAGVWNAQVLLRELRERGYDGGATILKDYLQPQRRAAREVAVRRFETPPGQQAQVGCPLGAGGAGPSGRTGRLPADALGVRLHPGPQPDDLCGCGHGPDAGDAAHPA